MRVSHWNFASYATLIRPKSNDLLHRMGCGLGLPEREFWEANDLPSLLRALVRADPNTGPVCAGHCIGPGVSILRQSRKELVHQVRMRTAVPTTLNER
jgi:hypothetical protein